MQQKLYADILSNLGMQMTNPQKLSIPYFLKPVSFEL